MKYEKVNCEIIDFDNSDIFMLSSNGSGTHSAQQQAAISQIANLCQGFSGSIDSNGNFTCTSFNHFGVGAAVIYKQTATGYNCLNFNSI